MPKRGWAWLRNRDDAPGPVRETWAERLARIRQTLHEARVGVQEALEKQNEAEARLNDVLARLDALLLEAELERRRATQRMD